MNLYNALHRYVDSYDLDKGPVFYEAYYPDPRDAYKEKHHVDRNTVLETSFQMPVERFAYSADTSDHPISINESFIIVNNDETLPQEWKAIMSRHNRNYDTITHKLVPFLNERSTQNFDNNKNSQVANIEEISKLVRNAISRDLENWNALERYLERIIHQDRPIPRLGIHSKKIHKNGEGDSYMLPVNRGRESETSEDSSERLSIFEVSLPRKLLDAHDGKRSIYFERVNANRNRGTSEMNVTGIQVSDTPSQIDVVSDSLPPENIFQPRPQLIKYMFFKRPVSPRLDKQSEKAIDESTWTSGDNPIREKVTDDSRSRRIEENNVKVTSIEISELPRHKTRHHHGEWSKRDYSIHRHRSLSAGHPTLS